MLAFAVLLSPSCSGPEESQLGSDLTTEPTNSARPDDSAAWSEAPHSQGTASVHGTSLPPDPGEDATKTSPFGNSNRSGVEVPADIRAQVARMTEPQGAKLIEFVWYEQVAGGRVAIFVFTHKNGEQCLAEYVDVDGQRSGGAQCEGSPVIVASKGFVGASGAITFGDVNDQVAFVRVVGEGVDVKVATADQPDPYPGRFFVAFIEAPGRSKVAIALNAEGTELGRHNWIK